MNEVPHTSPFDAIRRIDVNGNEYWSARELYRQLGYSRWEKFQKSLTEAQEACKNSGQVVEDHFHLQVKMVGIGSKARRPTEDYRKHSGVGTQRAEAIEAKSATILVG